MPLRGTPAHENSPWRLFSPQPHMALAGHPRAMKMAIFTPVPHAPGGPPPRDKMSYLQRVVNSIEWHP